MTSYAVPLVRVNRGICFPRLGVLNLLKRILFGLVCLAMLAISGALLYDPLSDIVHNYQEAMILNESLKGKVLKLQMESRDLHRKNDVFIYLPPSYEQSKERYPVVYLLHGNPGAARDWFWKGHAHETVERYILAGKIKPLILVCANGFGPRGSKDRTEFLNAANGSCSVENYESHELPEFIDSKFRTIRSPEARAICGNSSGGYGALNIGGKHPDVFRIIVSHSGFTDPKEEDKYVQHILGPEGPCWDENNPYKCLKNWRDKKSLHVYMDIGEKDDLLPENRQFARALEEDGIDHVFEVFKGDHEWPMWRERFKKSILFIDKWIR